MSYFDGLISNIQSKLSGWKCEMLSLVARKVLLQSVLSAIPSFMLATEFLSLFLILLIRSFAVLYRLRVMGLRVCLLSHGTKFASHTRRGFWYLEVRYCSESLPYQALGEML